MPAKVMDGLVSFYRKPSTGQLIFRAPRSRQVSAKVKAQQANFAKRMEGEKIATVCRGKKARAFWACLRREGERAYAGTGKAT